MDLSDKLAHGWPDAEWSIRGKIPDDLEADEYDRLDWFGPGDKPSRAEIEAYEILPDLVAYAARKRWEKEVGGTEVAGMPVFTDDRSKTLIMGARQAADADPGFTTQWKTATGSFITLDATMIMAISNAVLAHVAACFAREAGVIAAIEDETIATIAEIDDAFDAVEWPGP